MVLIGGSVPPLLVPGALPPHTGSLDVDLLLDPEALSGLQYAELLRLIEERGYRKTDKPFRYRRDVLLEGGETIPVEVDFLVPKGVRRKRGGRSAPDFRAIDADGAQLAIRLTQAVAVEGAMPSGARNRVEVTLPRIEAYVVMKAHALAGRLNEKDAYDILYCIQHWPGGSRAVADALRPQRGIPEVERALGILAEKFETPGHFGPHAVASFLDPADPDERAFVARDAYERVQALLEAVGFVDAKEDG